MEEMREEQGDEEGEEKAIWCFCKNTEVPPSDTITRGLLHQHMNLTELSVQSITTFSS